MAQGPRYRVPLRRRKENRTDYRSRKALIASELPRVIVRKSNRHVRIQIAGYHEEGDKILVSAFSQELKNLGWEGNYDTTPAAYLTGLMAGERGVKAGIGEAVLDIGRHYPAKGSVIFAALKGLIDAGVEIPHDDDVLPSDDRVGGKHLSENMQTKIEEIKSKLQKGGAE
ncbi:MAG: 50S ribosomal protein L18 [Thermoplasmata archaeon]|nr:50S ribosomal protein L18 [Thermoplasmata archaeon]